MRRQNRSNKQYYLQSHAMYFRVNLAVSGSTHEPCSFFGNETAAVKCKVTRM